MREVCWHGMLGFMSNELFSRFPGFQGFATAVAAAVVVFVDLAVEQIVAVAAVTITYLASAAAVSRQRIAAETEFAKQTAVTQAAAMYRQLLTQDRDGGNTDTFPNLDHPPITPN